MSILKPLIKWSGGKYDEYKNYYQYIPTDFKTYIEPFAGGLGNLYNMYNNKLLIDKQVIINDTHKELINFYNQLKVNKFNVIYDFMKSNKNEEKTYYNVRDKLELKDDIIKACRFYYLRKTCFRGMIRYNKDGHFNIPFGKYKTCNFEMLKDKRYYELFKNMLIYNGDFEDVLKKYDNKNAFVYLDPPYDSTFKNYGFSNFGEEEHKRLFNWFKNTKCKVLLIIGKTEFIEKLYKDYIKGRYDKKYKFRLKEGRIKADDINNEHLIITNY